jgi:Fe-S cluster assembly protein SufD
MFISVDKNVVINEPIQFIHLLSGSNTIANTRNYIQLAPFSKAEIIQSYYSLEAEKAFTNIINEINIAENAMLTINKLQCETENSFHISTDQVAQEKDSNFSINTITLNGTLVRNNLNIEVNGTNCETHLNGIYLLKENQHVDNHTVVDHKAPHCESHELYKGVIDDKATAVFNGKVFVRKDSQKINAFQSNANVLLSDDASVNSKPELEIYADDVKCSHGSTTGQLNEEAVFYLRARGISEKSARHLMVSAFIEDVISKIENEEVTNFTHSIIKEQFGWEF